MGEYLGHKVPHAVGGEHDALVLVRGDLEALQLGVRHLPKYERAL